MPSKKTLILFLIIAVLALAWYWYFGRKYTAPPSTGVETKEQKLLRESVTAPAGEPAQIPKEVLDKITAPSRGKPVSPEVIKSLTAPNK